MTIPFNRAWYAPATVAYVERSLQSGKTSGDGPFTKACHNWFETRYRFPKTLLTPSCTAALEMAALLFDIQPGDEVIMPSFTFVSTANAFALRGAKIVFADSCSDTPNIDPEAIRRCITPRTKAIVVVHYAGIACAMDEIMRMAEASDIFVLEDAALGLDAYAGDRPLGSFGHLAAFSFHDTKNISCGEGGLLVINDKRFAARAEIIREKGTNRSQFLRGEASRYTWVDTGSSYLPSDITAAVLLAQLEQMDTIQASRLQSWNFYHEQFAGLEQEGRVKRPSIPAGCKTNASVYYLTCRNPEERDALIAFLSAAGIASAFHYLPLHASPYYSAQAQESRELPQALRWSSHLIRLPLYHAMQSEELEQVTAAVFKFFRQKS